MTLRQFNTCFVLYCTTLILLSTIVMSGMVPKSEGAEKIIGDGVKIEDVTFKDINEASSGGWREYQEGFLASGSPATSYDDNTKSTRHIPIREFPLSKPRKSLGTAKHMADQFFEAKSRQLRSCTQLLAKLQNSREEIQNSIDKEVFNNLQSLLAQLNDYTDKYLNELKRRKSANLLLNERFVNLILEDFAKVFEHISQHFYPAFKIENSPATSFTLHIINWLAENVQDMHLILFKLLNREKMMEGLEWYTSSQIILKRGYIDFFKTDDIKNYLLNHQDLREIKNILKCNHFLFVLLLIDNK
ncbi:hypothetical protein PPACK8108_LOCUS19623 [Phakopsora pachyrhizi]|uniref:Secreted protein n=1 Tax=Phakopsora pachyrhizi TaxID=170000 RepID=A0AAV0BE13_PHAPC|nr:hypothetical protein PPACK8108_LOCUS19623 [Phakopsora pachyrhizi]